SRVVGSRRLQQPGDRRPAVHQPADGRVPPVQGVPEARRQQPPGTPGRARRSVRAGGAGLRVGASRPLLRGRLPAYAHSVSTLSAGDLPSRCDLLRSLHTPGDPLLLPNAWDVATARAVVAAGFPVVATTSWGVAASLGYDDHGAPGDEMLAAAGRIARGVDVPV